MTSSSKQQVSVIKVFALLVVVLVCACGFVWWHSREEGRAAVFEPRIEAIEAGPLCPWREPTNDMETFFPQSTHYERETHILSGLRAQLTTELGRVPTGDENALVVYRVYEGRTPVGTVLTRRVKGQYGAIEMVLGVGSDGELRGIRVQRHREPNTIAEALQEPDWLAAFVGKRADSHWAPDEALAKVPVEARPSAGAIIEGAKSMLVLLAAAERQPAALLHAAH